MTEPKHILGNVIIRRFRALLQISLIQNYESILIYIQARLRKYDIGND